MHPAPTQFEGPWNQLYDQHLAAVLPSVDSVMQFDQWMERYCLEPDPLFVVRGVRGTDRRGLYTTIDGTRFVAADNSPAWTVHAVLMEQSIRSYDQFQALIAQMPTHMFDVSKQVQQTANKLGWYVAHIARAKDGNTDYPAWDRREVARRFYLTIHPCNLFFVPGTRNRLLGENPDVIRFIASRYAARYGQLWWRFCEAARFVPGPEDPEFGSTLVRIGQSPTSEMESHRSAPLVGHVSLSNRYSASRLTFKRDRIEPLDWDETFEVETPMGTYRFTKRQFYADFPTIPQSRSYREGGLYNGKTLHLKAARFRLPDASRLD